MKLFFYILVHVIDQTNMLTSIGGILHLGFMQAQTARRLLSMDLSIDLSMRPHCRAGHAAGPLPSLRSGSRTLAVAGACEYNKNKLCRQGRPPGHGVGGVAHRALSCCGAHPCCATRCARRRHSHVGLGRRRAKSVLCSRSERAHAPSSPQDMQLNSERSIRSSD